MREAASAQRRPLAGGVTVSVLALGPEGVGSPIATQRLGGDPLLSAANVLDDLSRALKGTRDLPSAVATLGRPSTAAAAVWRRAAAALQPTGGEPSSPPDAPAAEECRVCLTQALARLDSPFGPLVTEVVAAGERHGRLAEACGEAAALLRERRPLLARGLLLTSNLWTDALLYAVPLALAAALLGVLAAGACAAVLVAGRSPRAAWHALRPRLPLVGPLYRALVFGRFAQVFATLSRVGAPVARCLELAAAVTGDLPLARELVPRLIALREGDSLARVLAGCPLLPASVAEILATGERSGRLDTAGEKLADYLRDDAEAAVDRISGTAAWLCPALLGVLVLVALIVFYGRMAPDGLPSPGEMWHNLLHGPSTGAEP